MSGVARSPIRPPSDDDQDLIDAKISAAIRVNSAAFSFAQSYSNIILGGGYAAFFFMWNDIREYIPEFWALISALCMIVSVSVFISFEIFKMIQNSAHLSKFSGILEIEGWRALDALREFEIESGRKKLKNIIVWKSSLISAGTTAIISIVILLFHIIDRLIQIPLPCSV